MYVGSGAIGFFSVTFTQNDGIKPPLTATSFPVFIWLIKERYHAGKLSCHWQKLERPVGKGGGSPLTFSCILSNFCQRMVIAATSFYCKNHFKCLIRLRNQGPECPTKQSRTPGLRMSLVSFQSETHISASELNLSFSPHTILSSNNSSLSITSALRWNNNKSGVNHVRTIPNMYVRVHKYQLSCALHIYIILLP